MLARQRHAVCYEDLAKDGRGMIGRSLSKSERPAKVRQRRPTRTLHIRCSLRHETMPEPPPARPSHSDCFNMVFNYDFPEDSDQFLHRVGRAGRFGTKGLAISFISSEQDQEILDQVHSRFEVNIPELPDEIDMSTYMSN